VEREIGRTWIRLEGRTELTLVVFGGPDSQPLLGAYALEGLRLAADPVGRRLTQVPGLLMFLGTARSDFARPEPGLFPVI
jgi:hypothetical protein